ncbi:MAG TPA: C39 family peptidase [Patescibacteria group bacterium]|nr:C39 family peptidase [Patescibacteria group bacterium]
MVLEKNPKTRPIAKRLLQLEDKVKGKPFASMARVLELSNYSCGPATLEMLLSFVGSKATQKELIKSIRVQKTIKLYGININDMGHAVKIVSRGKLVFWRKHRANVSDIALTIDKFKYPVGVEWQGDFYENEDEDRGHYSVVTSVNKESGFLRIADPYFNSFFKYKDLDRKYAINDFVKKWWDINEIKVAGSPKRRKIKDTRVMFVIVPKGENWPKKLGMVKAS